MVGNDKEIYIMTLSLGNFTTVSVVWFRSYSEGGDATLASSTFNVWKKKKKRNFSHTERTRDLRFTINVLIEFIFTTVFAFKFQKRKIV